MTDETDKSQVPTTVELSITKWSTFKVTIPSLIASTGVEINPSDYEDRLAFTDENGLLRIHGVNTKTGVVDWVIKNKVIKTSAEENIMLENPKDLHFKGVIDSFPILVNTEAELAFMKNLKLDVRDDSGMYGNGTARTLMTLLNNYRVGDGWSANPGDGCTTAYFVPRYYGPGANAPDVYNFNREATLLVVVELMMHGKYETHALVVR